MKENLEFIRESLSEAALYDHLAEESAELCHAAPVKAKALRREDPTPITPADADRMVREEFTDLLNCADALRLRTDHELRAVKIERWISRITGTPKEEEMTEKARQMREQEKQRDKEEEYRLSDSQIKMLTDPLQDLAHMDDPLEPIKVVSAYKSQCMVLDYRKIHEPGKIGPLDYAVIYSLWRQIPQEPRDMKKRKRGLKVGRCPVCGTRVSSWAEYCKGCGQRMLWQAMDDYED